MSDTSKEAVERLAAACDAIVRDGGYHANSHDARVAAMLRALAAERDANHEIIAINAQAIVALRREVDAARAALEQEARDE